MRSPSLFAIAPYHRRRNEPEIVHDAERWTIARKSEINWVYPRISYSFGSNAFRDGIQSELIARQSDSGALMTPAANRVAAHERSYMDDLTKFDIDSMPSAARLAEGIVSSIPAVNRNDHQIASRMEHFLASSGGFGYTIELTAESIPGLDPIEQFLTVDRKGHCQYFASALVMMLRSQGIPARIVVGYRTDEYNDLGQYFVARQLHAHAWVEALIDRDQLQPTRAIYGQPPADQYWLRLDPTPGGGGVGGAGGGGVGEVFDLAQNMWDDYVVEMDANRQEDALLNSSGLSPMAQSYSRFINLLTGKIAKIRAGELGGGALATRELFSLPAAIVGVVLTLLVLVLLKIRAPLWIGRKLRGTMKQKVERPSISFYAQTLDQLARIGVTRQAAQTPVELANSAISSVSHPLTSSLSQPLQLLTTAFYQIRFGTSHHVKDSAAHARHASPEIDQALDQLTKSVDSIADTSITARNAP